MNINYDNNGGNVNRVEYDYKVGDNVMLENNSAYKCETLYKGPYEITQTWTNVTDTLQIGAM